LEHHSHSREGNVPVAIIGIGCLFPKASGLKDYWRLISHGQDAITEVPETHWSAADYFDPDPKRPDSVYCTRGGYLSPVTFDPSEFGIPPSSLEATDTSQLLGLLAAKAALEDAGYGNGRDFNREKTSVILGVTGTQELVIPLGARLGHPHWRRALKEAGISPDKAEEVIQRISDAYVPWQESSFPGLLGNVVAGRISNRLNLGGTNCAVDAACASSMSAMHLALMELQAGRSDMVVTGGVDTLNDIFMHMCFSKTPILSPTGDVRPFSARADGSLLGEGVGLLVLKRLEDAEKDGDRVYAVIKALGSSSDGRSNSIYAPHAEGQMKALRRAYEAAHVDPETVDLIEAHGTGTRVGDMVEFTALRGVFEGEGDESENGRPKNWCAVGSVKSMIGHTKAAAGAAGLIKTVLSLHHKILPPTLKIESPDPKLKIEESPFYLSTRTRPWITGGDHPRRAGVSSFGFGGSNFHTVLEEYQPEKEAVSWDGAVEILALSGDTRQEVAARLEKLKQEVEAGIIDEDLSFKAAETRKEFSSGAPHRLLMVLEKTLDRFDDFTDLLSNALDAVKNNIKEETRILKNIFYAGPVQAGQLAFVFPGQGSQYVDMGRDLACRFPEAVHVLERADGRDKTRRLSDLIYPRPIQISEEKTEQENRLRSTDAAQPAIGAVNMFMTKILNRFGIQPDAVCGHSFGELCALWAAGWIDTDTLFDLAFLRGRLMAEAGTAHPGAMTAVKAPLEEIDRLIRSENLDVVLANRNSPDQGVLSGSEAAIQKAEAACREKGFGVRRLPVSAAFHSRMMTDAARPFAEAVKAVAVTPTDIPVFSNAAGTSYPTDPDAAKTVLGEQVLSPVDFVNEIKNMFESGVRTFVEVGPKSVLTGLVKNILKGLPFHAIPVDLSGGRRFGITDLARLLCHLAVLGHAVDLQKWEGPAPPTRKPRMRIPLTGANYRSPSKVPESAPAVQKPPLSAEKEEKSANRTLSNPENRSRSVDPVSIPPKTPKNHQQDVYPAKRALAEPAVTNNPRTATVPAGEYKRNMKKTDNPTPNPNQSAFVADAFRAVQEGLKSMQALQMQTAETHKRFLESQTQAGRTLQDMIESTQRLAEASMGMQGGLQPQRIPGPQVPEFQGDAPKTRNEKPGPPYSASAGRMDFPAPARTETPTRTRTPAPESRQAVSEPAHPPVHPTNHSPNHPPNHPMERRSSQAQVPTPAAESKPTVDSNRARIEEILLEVVSELTGYPAEMLALDMDIEADLGIDSIKRVEILSSFEEKMPELPPVSPEIMGTLKTLGQVVEYLIGEGAGGPGTETAKQPSAPAASSETSASNAAGNRERVEGTLLEVVSELTGYPAEMLALDMDIEADLGIDSIKRVEILSSFEEKMPELPPVSPEMMGTLKTLGQIVDYISESSGTDPVQESGGEASSAQTADIPTEIETSKPSGTASAIEGILLEVVSELTGYPSEMLALDMDIEADLGIDSIKRVEILSSFEEKMPELPPVSPEMMGTLKTLGQIVEYLLETSGGSLASDKAASSTPAAPPGPETAPEADTPPSRVERRVINPIRSPLKATHTIEIPGDRPVFITKDSTGLGAALAEALKDKGMQVVLDSPEKLLEVDLSAAGGMVILADAWKDKKDKFLKSAFELARKAAPGLLDSASEKGACFATVSRMDGRFGFSENGFENSYHGGLAGLSKTASVEWDGVCCSAIDLDSHWNDPKATAAALAAEILYSGAVEVGLDAESRWELMLSDSEYPEGKILLQTGDVVIVTGGARGVTAAATIALAREAGPLTLVLLGRSPLPEPEPEWLASLTDEAVMKKAILEHEFQDRSATPAELETAFRKRQAGREILENIHRLRSAGSEVLYHSVDVRDAAAVETVIQDIRKTHGSVKAVIHGAGALADRFIVDKTPEQFSRVFDTKVFGMEALLAAVADDPLQYLVFFSSVAARMGNQGQVDYAMANEVLNKQARLESLKRPDCRVISFNWGPWDGGMVTPSLRREFERQGVQLIPPAAGARCMVDEMRGDARGPVEVVIGAGLMPARDHHLTPPEVQSRPHSVPRALTLSFQRELDLEQYPILSAHILGGKALVPFSLMTEWIGHGALHENPGLFLHGLDDIRLLKEVEIHRGSKRLIRLLAGKAKRKGGMYEAEVEVRDGFKGKDDRVHFSARAILTDMPPQNPPDFSSSLDIHTKTYSRPMDEIYDAVLYQGVDLRGIREIVSCSSKGVVARLAPAPSPDRWMAEPLRSRWIGDPLVLDSAFQMAILWCYEEKGALSLPSAGTSYRQYRQQFPADGVIAVLEVQEADNRRMVGDFTFLDSQGAVVARLEGYEAVMDESLVKMLKAS